MYKRLAKEIAKGGVAGPFQSRPIPTLRVSPLGVVPKKTEGEFRVNHHLSYPTKNSVNDYIEDALGSVNYTKFDEAINMVHRLGRGAFFAKSGIKAQPGCCLYGRGISNFSVSNLITVTNMTSVYPSDVRYHVLLLRNVSLIDVCKVLGVPIAWEKNEGAQRVITFLGLEIDTKEMQVRLLEEKVRFKVRFMPCYGNKKPTCRPVNPSSVI